MDGKVDLYLMINTKIASNPVSLFDVSKQKWKFKIIILLLVVQILLFLLLVLSFSQETGTVDPIFSVDGVIWGLSFVFLGGFIFLPWFTFSLKCPQCNKSLVYYIMRYSPHQNFGLSFAAVLHEGCPACHVRYSDLK